MWPNTAIDTYKFVKALKLWWDRLVLNIKFEFKNAQHKKTSTAELYNDFFNLLVEGGD